jgi:hypothetical protein
MNEDWLALRAIYGADFDYNKDDDEGSISNDTDQKGDRMIRLEEISWVPPRRDKNTNEPNTDGINRHSGTRPQKGYFCGTAYMTLSTSKVAFARPVNGEGDYRYFTLEKSPVLKLDFLYPIIQDGPDDEREYGPPSLRLAWDYYPTEWPALDKDTYRSCLAKQAAAVLKEEGMAFAACQFLEYKALSSYTGSDNNHDAVSGNNRKGWRSFVDDGPSGEYPDYLLVILPPEMDLMYQPTKGTLVHPKKEAVVHSGRADVESPSVKTSATQSTTNSTLAFARHALIRFWKHLYTTSCPICLEDEVLYTDVAVLPDCQHTCCSGCFETYLRFKVQDLAQHRTNPFCCPVDTCQEELPIEDFCSQYLSRADMETIGAWHFDLKFPPAWSLDRCLATKACGGMGSMRRRYGGCVSISRNKKKSSDPPASDGRTPTSKAMQNLVFCQECHKTWCELCLKRVNGEAAHTHHTICEPNVALKFCRRYRAASPELQRQCQDRYPWIVSYSSFCNDDGAALAYIRHNGQRCPTCQTGVERTEGCFHMKCPTCATHFCYECGVSAMLIILPWLVVSHLCVFRE